MNESCTAADMDRSSGYTATLTVTTSMPVPCPVQSPCPTSPPAGSSPGGQAGKGPCPGRGYTCDDCIDGWFCPPSQTPAQSGPNGCFGWPCAHCSKGWFCIAQQDVGTCTNPGASRPLPIPGSSTLPGIPGQASFTVVPPMPIEQSPSSTISPKPADAAPTIRDPANGWSYSGCWADQPLFAVLDFTPETSFGDVDNEKCVRHCISNGYTVAATSFGDKCFCGQFLNGTRKLEDSACMNPCFGDVSQACGGDWSLLTYTPNGIPRGWAPVGEQPNPSPRPVPTIIELAYGGVEQSIATSDVVVGPTSGMDLAFAIESYGERYVQSQATLPDGVGPQTQCSSSPTGPIGASLTAPGSGRGSTSQSDGTDPTQSGDGSNVSSSSPRGAGGVAPGQQAPTPTIPAQQTPNSPGGASSTPDGPGTQSPGTPSSNNPNPTGPGGGTPNMTPGGIGPSSSGGYSGGSTNTSPGEGLNPSTPAGGNPNPNPSPSSPNGAGGVAPGPQSPTTSGGIGSGSTPSAGGTPATGPGGGGLGITPSSSGPSVPSTTNASPTSPNNGGGVAPGQQSPTTPRGIGPSQTSPNGSSPSNVPTNSPGGNGPGGQGLSTPSGNTGGTPTAPGGNGGGPNPSGGNLPTCTPGSSGINCIPPLPPGVGLPPEPADSSSFPSSGVPPVTTPPQPNSNGQATVSLPGVATPTNPIISTTQSNPRGASMTAPGRQSPSSSNSIPTPPGTDNEPGVTPAPTTGSIGGAITPGQSQTPTSIPNGGGPNSYNWPPGMVPYGDHPPFTTLAHMLSWKAPDGSVGASTLLARGASGEAEVSGMDFDGANEKSMELGEGTRKRWNRRHDSL